MRLNHRKIDYILKLMFYLMPILYIFIVALATESTTIVNFTNQLNSFIAFSIFSFLILSGIFTRSLGIV